MNFAFFGTPEFAAIILEKLIAAGFAPTVAVCNPDKPVGRKKIISPPPAKLVAQKYGVKIWQPGKLENKNWETGLGPIDFAIVAAYSHILRQDILAFPRLGMIGVHPSLLPKYRGASPIQAAILNGDVKTGTTLFLIDEKVDHGPILTQAHYPLDSTPTYMELEKNLAELSGDLLVKHLPDFAAGKISPRPQNEAEASHTRKFAASDAYIAPEDLEKAGKGRDGETARAIERKIRALNPEPGAWTTVSGKRLKLLEATLAGDTLILQKVQMEGKKTRSL